MRRIGLGVRRSAWVRKYSSSVSGGSAAILVVDDGKPVGVLTRADLLAFLAD